MRFIRQGLLISIVVPQAAFAFPYEVLQTETLGREAATVRKGDIGQLKWKGVLLQGDILTEGTDAKISSTLVINEARIMQQLALTNNLAFRIANSVFWLVEEEKGNDAAPIQSDATWIEAQPRASLIYSAQNGLDFTLGADGYYVQNYDFRSRTDSFSSHDTYQSATYARPHVAITKHGAGFDAGFAYQAGVEKKRGMTKSNTIDNSSLQLEDVLFEPTTVSIFLRHNVPFGSVFTEFSAIEASGGGNRSARGATAEEDYFRVQLGGSFPFAGNSLVFEPTLIYKSLSYADNRNVTLPTIPAFGLHLDLNFDNAGLPLFAGLILASGADGQSLAEFNAKYKLFAYGASFGLNWGF